MLKCHIFVMFTLFVQKKRREMESNNNRVAMELIHFLEGRKDLLLCDSSESSETSDSSESSETSDSSELSETSDSSESNETSDSDDDEPPCMKRTCVENYTNIIVKYTDVEFKKHFRLPRVVAETVIGEYSMFLLRPRCGERADVEIYITLWFLANTETYQQIGERFHITESSVHRILYRVVKWLVEVSPKYIKWPTASEMQNNQIQFAAMKGVPDVVGSIDCSHIKVNPPKRVKQAYYNRKKFCSVLLQGIVNAEKKFIDVYCGEPGSIHDAGVLQKSTFGRRITEDESIIIPGGVLLGDSAYGASRYLVPPFEDFGNLTEKQLKFNYLHSSTRIVVENAFGLLKGRFRRLHFFETTNLGFVTNCILCACVLHNICISENDSCDIEYLDDEVNNTQNYTGSGGIDSNNGARARQQMFEKMDSNGLLN